MEKSEILKTEARFGITKRGKEMLIDYQSFSYTKDNDRNGRSFWKCTEKDAKGCKGRAATVDGQIVHLSDNHCHTSDITRIAVRLKEQSALAKATENVMVPPRRVFAELTYAMNNQSEMASLTPKRVLVRRINAQRKKSRQMPDEPSDWEDLEELPACQTLIGERFLLGNSIKDNRPGCIVLSSDWQLNLLGQADSVTADGTFKTCPQPFCQIYCLVANFHKDRRNIPVLFALLPDKTAQSYEYVWSTLANYILEPIKAIRVDFESSDLLAIRQVLPDVRLEACFFHFRSAIRRKLASLHLIPVYNQHESLQIYVKSLISLAFVPDDKVGSYFEDVQMTKPTKREPAIDQFEAYFESTYIGRKVGSLGTRRAPRYPIKFWNQYERALAKEDKTSNSAESWNSAWAGSLESKAKFWTVLEALKREEALAQSKQIEGAEPQTGRQSRRQVKDERIAQICGNISSHLPIDYLHIIAQQFELD